MDILEVLGDEWKRQWGEPNERKDQTQELFYKRLPAGVPKCGCNKKEPQLVIEHSTLRYQNKTYESWSIAIRAEQEKVAEWVELNFYVLPMEKLNKENVKKYTSLLTRAWKAINEGD